MRNLRRSFFNFFVPHLGNNFRAKALHHTTLATYLLVGLLFVAIARSNTHLGQVLGFATDITADKLYSLTNEVRHTNNLPPLTLNPKLSEAAAAKGRDMIGKNYWAHYGPDGTAPWDFFSQAGYNYEYAGENLAKNFLYSNNVVDAWMESPSHRENILRSEYTEVGYAMVNGVLQGEETTVVVQLFGKPEGARAVAAAPSEAAPMPTTAAAVVAPATPQTLAFQQRSGASGPLPVGMVSLILGFLLATVAIDLYFAARLKVFHIHGKNLAHFIFLFFVLSGIVIFISKGTIL